MGSLSITPDMVSLLAKLTERTELRDEAGKVLGVFTPQVIADDLDWVNGPFDLEKAERIWAQERHLPGKTLAEFWPNLKSGGAPSV